jgi:hypothetical protein
MIALVILATTMLAFLGAFLQSRKSTESNVMNSAVTSVVYGLIEQMKGLSYTDLLPSYVADTDAPAAPTPHIRLHLNQDVSVWLTVRHQTDAASPWAPTATPTPIAAASTVGSHPSGAVDNQISIPLSTVTGAASQNLNVNIWVWIDNLSDTTNDVADVKRVTVVYTYTLNTGTGIRTIRKRETFLRTRYDL